MPGYRDPVASPRDALRTLKRHRYKAAFTFLILLGGAIAAVLYWPPKYASDAKLFVRLGRESVSLDPTATTGQVISVNESRESEINSILELLQSRTLLERVADRLTPAVILNRQLESPERTREAAIEKLDKSIAVDAPRRSSVITIHAEGRTPELARDIAQRFVESYLESHVGAHRTQGSHQFFQNEARLAEDRLADAQNALSASKSEARLISLDAERQSLQARLSAGEAAIAKAEASLAAGEIELTALRTKVKALPERLIDDTVTGLPNVAGDGIKQKFFELQIKERELVSKMTDEHPALFGVREQLEQLKKIVDAEPGQRTQTTEKVNRIREGLETRLHIADGTVESLRGELQVLQSQRQAALDSLQALNKAEVRLTRLARDVELAQADSQAYAQKLEQTRINQALDAERISNVNVVQPPTLVRKAAGPARATLLAGGFLVAVCGALFVVFLAELTTQSPLLPERVVRQIEVPIPSPPLPAVQEPIHAAGAHSLAAAGTRLR